MQSQGNQALWFAKPDVMGIHFPPSGLPGAFLSLCPQLPPSSLPNLSDAAASLHFSCGVCSARLQITLQVIYMDVSGVYL